MYDGKLDCQKPFIAINKKKEKTLDIQSYFPRREELQKIRCWKVTHDPTDHQYCVVSYPIYEVFVG